MSSQPVKPPRRKQVPNNAWRKDTTEETGTANAEPIYEEINEAPVSKPGSGSSPKSKPIAQRQAELLGQGGMPPGGIGLAKPSSPLLTGLRKAPKPSVSLSPSEKSRDGIYEQVTVRPQTWQKPPPSKAAPSRIQGPGPVVGTGSQKPSPPKVAPSRIQGPGPAVVPETSSVLQVGTQYGGARPKITSPKPRIVSVALTVDAGASKPHSVSGTSAVDSDTPKHHLRNISSSTVDGSGAKPVSSNAENATEMRDGKDEKTEGRCKSVAFRAQMFQETAEKPQPGSESKSKKVSKAPDQTAIIHHQTGEPAQNGPNDLGDTPEYAQVDKTKKPNVKPRMPRLSRDEVSSGGTDDKETSHYDGFVVLREEQKLDAPTEEEAITSPPVKPPRTFAHDQYIQKKALKKELKRKSKEDESVQAKPKNAALYEEIEQPKDVSKKPSVPERTSATFTKNNDYRKYDAGYEDVDIQASVEIDVKISDPPRVKKPESKPPPPPRPPPPSPNTPGDGSTQEPFWKKETVGFVRHNQNLPGTAFVDKKAIANPGYQKQAYILKLSNPSRSRNRGGMKHASSDEYLYSEVRLDSSDVIVENGIVLHPRYSASNSFVGVEDDPIYHDPVDMVRRPQTVCEASHGVAVDAEGYAIPDTGRHTQAKKFTGAKQNAWRAGRAGTLGQRNHPNGWKPPLQGSAMGVASTIQKRNRPQVQEKLSRAYSVLRINPANEGNQGSSTDVDDDSDKEVDPEEHQKRVQYVSAVRLRAMQRAKKPKSRTFNEFPSKMFNYAMVVCLEKVPEKNVYKQRVMFHFPEQVPALLQTISEFCFPDASVWRPVTHYSSETFSFVLTNADGSRQYGYCRRVLPTGSGNRLPEVYCVVSQQDIYNYYANLLGQVEKRRRISMDNVEEFLQAAYSKPVPLPGSEAWVRAMGADNKKETIFIKRSEVGAYTDAAFESLLTRLTVDLLLKIFGAILLERRIIFMAQHLGTLTSCVHAITTLLYPFTWQHVFIPVLPHSMLEVCGAPTPFIIGVLTSLGPQLKEIELGEVLLVDLDNRTLLQYEGDEGRLIPKKLQKALRNALKDEADAPKEVRNMLIAEAFLRLFVETVGHYTDYICTQMDGKLIFEKTSFITSVSSKSIRMFLEWFTGTQMFEMFMEDRINGQDSLTLLFETRILEYRREMTEANPIRQNMKEVGRKMLNFLSESRDKLKRKFNNNVFI